MGNLIYLMLIFQTENVRINFRGTSAKKLKRLDVKKRLKRIEMDAKRLVDYVLKVSSIYLEIYLGSLIQKFQSSAN